MKKTVHSVRSHILQKTKVRKKHGKYFCSLSLCWIAFLSLLTLIAAGNFFYQHYSQPKVLGISTTLYRDCAFWDIICPIRNFLSDQERLRAKIDNKITPTPGKFFITLTPAPASTSTPTLIPAQ